MEPDDVHAEPIRIIAAEEIRTIRDLEAYLSYRNSTIVTKLIEGAIQFLSKSHISWNGRRDWKAVRERKRIGLDFQLTPEHVLTVEIIAAIRHWMATYGRDIGTTFFDIGISKELTGDSNPRETAFKLLDQLGTIVLLREEKPNNFFKSPVMEVGRVKFFSARGGKNFGFITLESGEEIYFNFHNWFKVSLNLGGTKPALVRGNYRIEGQEWHVPRRDERIIFQRKPGMNGPKASPWCFAEDWERIEKNITEELTFEQLPTKELS